MPPPKNIVELRKLLAEKFPGVRMDAGRPSLHEYCTTGIPQFDFLLGGGLAKGAITELVTPGIACGSALFLTTLFRHVYDQGQWTALIDSSDSFDPASLDNDTLSRLLWIRCDNAGNALKAADILLRDGNMPLIVLDLVGSPATQLRKVPSSTWHRLLRIVETSSLTFLALTPTSMIGCHVTRVFLDRPFSIKALEQPAEQLVAQLKPRLAETAQTFQREARIA